MSTTMMQTPIPAAASCQGSISPSSPFSASSSSFLSLSLSLSSFGFCFSSFFPPAPPAAPALASASTTSFASFSCASLHLCCCQFCSCSEVRVNLPSAKLVFFCLSSSVERRMFSFAGSQSPWVSQMLPSFSFAQPTPSLNFALSVFTVMAFAPAGGVPPGAAAAVPPGAGAACAPAGEGCAAAAGAGAAEGTGLLLLPFWSCSCCFCCDCVLSLSPSWTKDAPPVASKGPIGSSSSSYVVTVSSAGFVFPPVWPPLAELSLSLSSSPTPRWRSRSSFSMRLRCVLRKEEPVEVDLDNGRLRDVEPTAGADPLSCSHALSCAVICG
mmetsp:Transcript_6985/g.16969  ORF Transcript_6985/g.16969 Transcript_6985/m.16969 type:complete len:326 (+) Transcript_6985:1049-2026(+)